MPVKTRIRALGEIGIIKDVPPYDLPPNGFSDGLNVRFRKQHMEKMGGVIPVLTNGKPTGIPYLTFERPNSQKKVYATGTHVYHIEGVDYHDITPTGVTFKADDTHPWTYTTLSNTFVINNPHDNPYGMQPEDDKLVPLPGWGKPSVVAGSPVHDWKAGVIRKYKNYLIALAMSENGEELQQRVRWSDAAKINKFPTNWHEDDDTTDGGFNDLSDCEGRIIDGRPLRDSFIIYTNKDTYLMDYTGGVNVFNFSKLYSDSGVLTTNCVAEFEGKHFVVSQNDIFVHNGSDRQSVASNRVKNFLIEEISRIAPASTKVISVPTLKEIWIMYVGNGGNTDQGLDKEGACNKAAIWNWEFDTWTFYELPDLFDISTMTAPEIGTVEWSSFLPADLWDHEVNEQKQWKTLGSDFTRSILYGSSKDGCLYALDYGVSINRWKDSTHSIGSTQPVICWAERQSMDFDEVVEDIRSYKLIKNIVPQISGSGTLGLHIGGEEDPNLSPLYNEFQSFDILNDTKFDTFANYRYVAIKFIDSGAGSWKFTGYDVELEEGGTR